MSLHSQLQNLKDNSRIVLNDRFMGDVGAKQLSVFLASHRRVESLEIKSNDITPEGFIQIFTSLTRNPNLKQLVLEYNSLGQNQYTNWQDSFQSLIKECNKLERLNISNNKISNAGFERISSSIAKSKSLKLLELRYNIIESQGIDHFIQELKRNKNQILLFVELAGNKTKKGTNDSLESFLKLNRQKNPISKDKILMSSSSMNMNLNQVPKFRNNAIEDISVNNLSKQNIIRHLEDILDQNRKDTTEMKIRLQNELQELQKREKNDARELQQMDNKCSQLLIHNRNLKFQLDRTTSQHLQIQRDQQYHIRVHQEKLRDANKELTDLETKYNQIENRMNKQHQMKMKQIAREWENRLRSVQDKIRMTENQNNILDNQIKKQMEKKERLKVQYLDEENIIRTRVQQQEGQRYGFKISGLETRLREIEESRQHYIRRNQELIYQIEKAESDNIKSISDLEEQQLELKAKEDQFVRRNKDFINRNQKLKSDMKLKQITIQKLQEETNRLNEEIQVKKSYNRQQIVNIVNQSQYTRIQKEEEKQNLINKMNELEANLRTSQLQNSKLRQEYAILAQKLQIGLGKAVQDVFASNSLY